MLFVGNVVYGKSNRHDPARLMDGDSPTTEIIEYIFGNFNQNAPYTLVLFDVFHHVDTDAGNCALVTVYSNLGFQYYISQPGYIRTVLVVNSKIIRPVILVVDPYWLKFNFGIQAKFTDLDDSLVPQSNICCFHVILFNI